MFVPCRLNTGEALTLTRTNKSPGGPFPPRGRCGECDGLGRLKEKQEIEVDIPAGIEDGMKVKLPGHGDMPLGGNGPPGDLFVRVNVKASPDRHTRHTWPSGG
jgi:DnaJ-class molecular chaperone